jgi:hypothetical protein
MTPFLLLRQMLDGRLERSALKWLKASSKEIANEASSVRFSALLSLASRHAKNKQALDPTEAERLAANKALAGWNPERWTLLESLRVALVLGRTDLAEESGALAIEEAFAYADEGEQRALYRCLALLPEPERFVWRAGEGCRSNMLGVFEANVLDTPFASTYFDEVAFNQAAIKCVFAGAPLWRLWGLDTRLTEDLSHSALDLADERRSAGREIQGDLWLCLGEHHTERALDALELELRSDHSNEYGVIMAIYGFLRAGQRERLEALVAESHFPQKGALREALDAALNGTDVYSFCRAYHS